MRRQALFVALGVLACRSEPKLDPAPARQRETAPPRIASTPRPKAQVPDAAPSSTARDALASLGEPAGSCDWTNVVSTCFEAVGTTPSARDAAFRALAQTCKSVPARGPCPGERRVGSCSTPDGFVEHYYAAGSRPYTANEARAECESREGRWLD